MTSFRMFGMPHLSEDAVAAFADGVLSPAAMVRAEKHCSECPDCAEAVRVQREAVIMLRTAAAPSLPSGLLDRLTALPSSVSLPPSRGLPTAVGVDGVPVFVAHHRARAGEIPPPIPPGLAPSTAGPAAVVRPRHRLALPVGVLASAAAVVAVGALGSSAELGSGNGNAPANQAPALIAPVARTSTALPSNAGATSLSPTTSPFSIVGVGKSDLTP